MKQVDMCMADFYPVKKAEPKTISPYKRFHCNESHNFLRNYLLKQCFTFSPSLAYTDFLCNATLGALVRYRRKCFFVSWFVSFVNVNQHHGISTSFIAKINFHAYTVIYRVTVSRRTATKPRKEWGAGGKLNCFLPIRILLACLHGFTHCFLQMQCAEKPPGMRAKVQKEINKSFSLKLVMLLCSRQEALGAFITKCCIVSIQMVPSTRKRTIRHTLAC